MKSQCSLPSRFSCAPHVIKATGKSNLLSLQQKFDLTEATRWIKIDSQDDVCEELASSAF